MAYFLTESTELNVTNAQFTILFASFLCARTASFQMARHKNREIAAHFCVVLERLSPPFGFHICALFVENAIMRYVYTWFFSFYFICVVLRASYCCYNSKRCHVFCNGCIFYRIKNRRNIFPVGTVSFSYEFPSPIRFMYIVYCLRCGALPKPASNS